MMPYSMKFAKKSKDYNKISKNKEYFLDSISWLKSQQPLLIYILYICVYVYLNQADDILFVSLHDKIYVH